MTSTDIQVPPRILSEAVRDISAVEAIGAGPGP